MFYYGVDNAYPFTVEEAYAIVPTPQWIPVYIGGPYNAGKWSPASTTPLRQDFHLFPLYVGQNFENGVYTVDQAVIDANEAIALAKTFGFPDGPLGLDTEASTNQYGPENYCLTFHKVLWQAGYIPIQYCDIFLAKSLANKITVPTNLWLAYWILQQELPTLSDIPLNEDVLKYYHAIGWQFRNTPNYDLSISDDRFLTMPNTTVEPVTQENRVFFPQTGFAIQEGFLAYWNKFGGLENFGYPISNEFQRLMKNGDSIRCQWFERARFEWHPRSNPDRFDVELGNIGTEILVSNGDQVNYPQAFVKQHE